MEKKFVFNPKLKRITIILMIIGLTGFITAIFVSQVDQHRIWANLLLNTIFFLTISLAGTFFIAVHYIANAGWHTAIKRIPEAMGTFLPIAGMLMLIILFFGKENLYPWVHEISNDPILEGKIAFLNIPFFMIRTIIYLAGWVILTMILRKYSLNEDLEGGIKYHRRSKTISALFLVFFAITSSTFAWDWIMSTDPHWYSTLFGWYTFSSFFVCGLAVITLIVIYLKKQGYLEIVNENHLHDLGKFMFAFSIFWAYLWFSQYMLIWYANIPEETLYFIERLEHYKFLFFANLVLNFLFPFLILMSRDAKRNIRPLTLAAIFIIIGHWLDFYLMIMPGIIGENWNIGILEIGGTLFYVSLFIFIVFNSLTKGGLIPKNNPYLQESIEHHI